MNVTIRLISPADGIAVANIIRTVMPEFGAGGAGFAIHDTEVDNMYQAYSDPSCAYYVCEVDGKVIGGGGIAPLQGGSAEYCELKKMYFLSEGRGLGLGYKTLQACIQAAQEIGYIYCYLETFNTMDHAMHLYEKAGFKKIEGPLGNTGHFACDRFYLLKLK
ncbi:MAG TPA: GNAT family N-acetyltransferase [Ohtaekwangia sp.]|uniref:GNAT family N-acetyltransferase n=1 Tax=Ohtaekwangia sp. TaxID=2066019 RepID=UPI002F921FC6